MKKSRFSESQIVAILKEVDAGRAVAEVIRRQRDQSGHLLRLEEQVRRLRGLGS